MATSIKPIDNSNKDNFDVIFGESRNYKTSNGEYKNISIENEPLFFKLSSCKIVNIYQNKPEGNDQEKRRARLYISITNKDDIEMIQNLDKKTVSEAYKNKNTWFKNCSDADEELIKENFKSMLRYNTEYNNYNAYIDVSFRVYKYKEARFKDMTDDNKVYENADYQMLIEKLPKGSIVDLAVNFRNINVDLSNDEYKFQYAAEQINLIGLDEKFGNAEKLPGLTYDDFDVSNINLTDVEKHPKAGSNFCKINYNDKVFRGSIYNTIGSVFRNETPDGKTSYSLNINLDNEEVHKMYSDMSNSVFKTLVSESKKYYGSKKSEAKLGMIYTPFGCYSKKDQELIKSGEEPKYPAQLWIKLYYDDTNGFGNKFKNIDTNEFYKKPEELVGLKLKMDVVTFYNKHVWFGKKTSVAFVLDHCNFTTESNVSCDMDSVALPASPSNTSTQNNQENDEEEESDITDTSDDDDEDED